MPLRQLLIETDAPYLAPQSHRGKLNEPAFIAETAVLIAAVKGIPVEEVVTHTANNARQLFGIVKSRGVFRTFVLVAFGSHSLYFLGAPNGAIL